MDTYHCVIKKIFKNTTLPKISDVNINRWWCNTFFSAFWKNLHFFLLSISNSGPQRNNLLTTIRSLFFPLFSVWSNDDGHLKIPQKTWRRDFIHKKRAIYFLHRLLFPNEFWLLEIVEISIDRQKITSLELLRRTLTVFIA